MVIGALMNKLDVCRKVFDETAERVTNSAKKKEINEVQRYIDGLRTNVTGTVEFWYVALFSLRFAVACADPRPSAASSLSGTIMRNTSTRMGRWISFFELLC